VYNLSLRDQSSTGDYVFKVSLRHNQFMGKGPQWWNRRSEIGLSSDTLPLRVFAKFGIGETT
jgi:hypothetical protein